MSLIAGIDGCPKGWVCLIKNSDTGVIRAFIIESLNELLSEKLDLALIDIPIGLTNSGARDCDEKARKSLKAPRASSVFPAPIRPILAAKNYTDACRIGTEVHGKKISKQAWEIIPKIKAADDFLRADPERNRWLREIHPELCFWEWNNRTAMVHSKKRTAGRIERESLVLSVYGKAYEEAQVSLPKNEYANDDLLDAFAALWSAERVMSGKAFTIPASPPTDSCGLRMEMVV